MKTFFEYAKERQAILLRRKDGQAKPWTDDRVLLNYRFCNVYREDDTTTVWFRVNVRDKYKDPAALLLATVVFRWFNRIKTGEAIFCQLGDYADPPRGRITSAFDHFMETGDTSGMKMSILRHCGSGPYITGSYIIKTPDGLTKLDGVLKCLEWFWHQQHKGKKGLFSNLMPFDWRWLGNTLSVDPGHTSLEDVWYWLCDFPYLGDFMAYEIVTDLRHTPLLNKAPDIYTWANPGPGAMRGLNRIHGRDLNFKQNKYLFIVEMRDLLWKAEESKVWPHVKGSPVEMRDIEHTLCEYDKYIRTYTGEGRPRQVYKGL